MDICVVGACDGTFQRITADRCAGSRTDAGFRSDVFVTVTYTEQINVRNGPSTVLYDIIGNMQPGETAQALGVSPGRDWVQIVFPAGPGGLAWVHTSLIAISAGKLADR